MKTILIDIDGTILCHYGSLSTQLEYKPKLLSGVKEKFEQWDRAGYKIILLTGRRECMRQFTEKQLLSVGLFFDQLVMNVGGGERVLINDMKPDGTITASSHNVERNKGISELEI